MESTGVEYLFPPIFRQAIHQLQQEKNWTELFLRAGEPVFFFAKGKEYVLGINGNMQETNSYKWEKNQVYMTTLQDMQEILHQATKATPFAYEEEIAQGYLTLEGGHRLGFAGEMVRYVEKGNEGIHFRYISGMMLRIARERKGCADKVLPFLIHKDGIYNTLIISPPGCGKTTMLRDCVRQLSGSNQGKKIAVIDERMEIAASRGGIPQFDLGMRTNVLSGCKKGTGFVMAVRSLSPEILAADEIGFQEESKALLYGIYSGCGVLCTTHGSSIEEVQSRNGLSPLFQEGVFKRYVILHKTAGRYLAMVQDERGDVIYDGMGNPD